MKILLDTHAFLWLTTDDKRLSPRAKKLFLDMNNQLYLSAVSAFEIATKYKLGKLHLHETPEKFIENRIRNNSLHKLAITHAQTYHLTDLPLHHRDPFDRLLIAQAIEENMPLMSTDEVFSQYPLKLIW